MQIFSLVKDIDRDGGKDLLLFFCISDLIINEAFDFSTTELVLNGNTFDGTGIIGIDSVTIVDDDDAENDDDDDDDYGDDDDDDDN